MRLLRIRFTIRRMMIAIAVLGLLLAVVPPWWRYWFQSPWRLVTITNYISPDGTMSAAEVRFSMTCGNPPTQPGCRP